jgi:glutaredoxin
MFIILLMAIVVITSLNGVASTTKISIENTGNQIKNVLNDNQTHGVLAEYATTTACPYCPTASSQLYSIYNSGDYDFDFVTIVVDKITELPLIAQGHLADRYRELGVHSVPDVYFDGGYKNILGKQSDEQPYRTSIEQSGTRSVPQVEIDLNAEWKSSNILKITAEVQSNDPEFDGKIRIYITEISSRWNDQQGKPYHYTVLDILVDKSLKAVSLDKSNAQQTNTLNTITVTKWWYGDITKDNCMLIATVFDKDTDYAIQTASTKPDDKSNNDLSTKSYTKLLVVNGVIGKIYPIFEEINEWEDAGISTQRPYSLSLAPNNILQKLLEIFPNSFTLLRYLYGL